MRIKALFLIALTMVIITWGCSDEWLNDIEPQGRLLQVNYYQTEEEFKSGLVAVYSTLKIQYWTSWSSWYMWSNIQSDDAVVHGGGRLDRPELWDVDEFLTNPETGGLLQIWNRSYYGIYRANVLLENLANRTDASDTIKQMGAEARMLRAYFYFDLVRMFGECPLIDKVLVPEEYHQPKASKEEIFGLITDDLRKAAEILPVAYSGADKYRVSKYAAHGLLGKVYTYMASPFYNLGTQYYDSAAVHLLKVINESPYALLSDFDQVWWWENEFNNETLMEISLGFMPGDSWGWGPEHTGSVIQQLNGPRGISVNDTLIPGWGFDMVSTDLVQAFKGEGDSIRLHGTTLAEWQMAQWGITGFERNEGYTGHYTKKRTTWLAQNPNGHTFGWNTNERVLRLADIYLLYAEVMYNLNDEVTAREYVNRVRERVNLAPITSTGADLLADIKLERRLELAQEGNRFFDLVRWNDTHLLEPLGFTKGKNEHFPIPLDEINNSGGVLTQNPAYN